MFKHQTIPTTNERTINSVADFKDYHLSHDGSSMSAYGCETTALVLKNTVFFVLKGDHRDAMQALAEKDGLQGCFDYFLEKLSLAHKISEHHNVVADNDQFSIASNARKYLGHDNITRLKEAARKLKEDH
ncbi:hypothetical protein [Sulfitobacter sp. R18_1]|uniref:hypothetical protein n=1 Tax=Sulfitobacter sp. R18_1 TaxID=2821104 RepID=UPI001AD9B4E3|nr:hypothetical protein [Sulfitobacter sp. R18_1]MBO9428186.1 hypothetical protein [Sulfitobacter sp. R18_1]